MTVEHVCFEELLFDFRNVVAGDDPWQFIRVYNVFHSNTVIPGVKMNQRGERTLDGQFLKCDWEGAVTGRIHTSDGRWSAEFDAVPFFIGMPAAAVEDLLEAGDGQWISAPEVASFMADIHFNVWQISRQAEKHGVDLSCEIDRTAMREWLDRNPAHARGPIRTTPLQVLQR